MISHVKKVVSGTAVAGAAVLLPALAFAQQAPAVAATGGDKGLLGVMQTVGNLLAALVPIIIALAVIYFLWGLLTYLFKAGEEKDKAREQMIWGIIAIAVMVSVWGLVGILQATFNVGNSAVPTVKIFPGQ